MKMGQTECSETSAHKIQMPGYNPEESIQHLEHGKSLKSRIVIFYLHVHITHHMYCVNVYPAC